MTEAMNEYLIIVYNLEDTTDSDLKKESLMRKLDSVIGEFMESTSHTKDDHKIGENT